MRIQYFLLFCLLYATTASAQAFTNVHTVSEDPADSPDYSDLNDAVEDATCGDLVLVYPGDYSDDGTASDTLVIDGSTSGLTKDCSGSDSLTIAAVNAAVDMWAENEIGAGDLHSACALDPSTQDVDCDRGVVSFIKRITHDEDVSNLRIVGFETHRIDFNGCDDCVIERNFFNVNYDACLTVNYADRAEIRGNRIYRCGGDDSGDQDLRTTGSVDQVIHHNDLYGSGEANGPGIEGDGATCTASDWQDCLADFHGTDGYTVANANQCGTRIHHNRFYDHAERYDDNEDRGDDGDAIDLKTMQCSSNPVHIYDNEFWGQQGDSQILFHNGASGVRFYNNVVRDGDQSGIFFQAGQKCADPSFGAMNDYRIFNNIIRDNGEFGIYVWDDCSDSTAERSDVYDIRLFNNLLVGNGDAGLFLRWLTDDGVEHGTTTSLPSDSWMVSNNIFLDNGLVDSWGFGTYDVIVEDAYDDGTSSAIQLEDYLVFSHNIVVGELYFSKTYLAETDRVFTVVEDFDAAGYGSDDTSTSPSFFDASSHDYRLRPWSHGLDMALDFAVLLDASDLLELPIEGMGGGRRPEHNLNDIGPWEECADFDGDGLGICIDPQEGQTNLWYWINSDSSGSVLAPPSHYHFVAGDQATAVFWRGTPLFTKGVYVHGVTDEGAAQPTVHGILLGTPDDFGIAVEIN